MKPKLSDKTGTTLWATACFCSSLFVFAPSSLFLINQTAFSFDFKELLLCLVPLALLLMLALSIPLLLLDGSLHRRITALLVALSFLVWFQGKVMGWPYGPLDGRILWEKYRIYDVIDVAIWSSVITICTLRASFFYGWIRLLAQLLIFTQLALVAIIAFQTQKDAVDLFTYDVDETSKFEFSKHKNVILLLLDEFQSDIFQEIVEQDKKLEGAFDGFTYFRNSLATFSSTDLAVPAILTGRFYDNSEKRSVFLKEAFLGGSLPKVLKEHAFQVDLFPALGSSDVYIDEPIASNFQKAIKRKKKRRAARGLWLLFDLTMLRSLPGPVKKLMDENLERRLFSGSLVAAKTDPGRPNVPNEDLGFFESMTARAQFEIEKNTFKFFYLRGMHPPLWFDKPAQTFPAMEMNRKNYTNQAKAYLALCKKFLEVLKRKRAYDNSFIMIMGDHGCGETEDLQMGATDDGHGHDFPHRHIMARGIPLVLVKPFGSRGEMKVSDAPVSMTDIPKTIISELKLEANFPGVSMFEQNTDINRKRYFGHVAEADKNGFMRDIKMYAVSGFSWLSESWREECVLFPKNSKGFSKTAEK